MELTSSSKLILKSTDCSRFVERANSNALSVIPFIGDVEDVDVEEVEEDDDVVVDEVDGEDDVVIVDEVDGEDDVVVDVVDGEDGEEISDDELVDTPQLAKINNNKTVLRMGRLCIIIPDFHLTITHLDLIVRVMSFKDVLIIIFDSVK